MKNSVILAVMIAIAVPAYAARRCILEIQLRNAFLMTVPLHQKMSQKKRCLRACLPKPSLRFGLAISLYTLTLLSARKQVARHAKRRRAFASRPFRPYCFLASNVCVSPTCVGMPNISVPPPIISILAAYPASSPLVNENDALQSEFTV